MTFQLLHWSCRRDREEKEKEELAIKEREMLRKMTPEERRRCALHSVHWQLRHCVAKWICSSCHSDLVFVCPGQCIINSCPTLINLVAHRWEIQNPKIVDLAPKKKWKFMQKYWHKGAFFQVLKTLPPPRFRAIIPVHNELNAYIMCCMCIYQCP